MAAPVVLQLSRHLDEYPEVAQPEGVSFRNYGGSEDIQPWLDLRKAAFADMKTGIRDWQPADFEAEFLQARWWSTQRMWMAICEDSLAGTATLAVRGSGDNAKPVIHWMMVDPSWRRRGVGRWLVAKLESQAWDQGHRRVFLETHASWRAAVAFYESLGYRPE